MNSEKKVKDYVKTVFFWLKMKFIQFLILNSVKYYFNRLSRFE